MNYPNLFKSRYPKLIGRAWLKSVSSEDKQAFSRLGMQEHGYGRMGGKARAYSAKRDGKGRFVA